ncbi:hypothetical protein [Bartonella queenslandensis]|uniref:hypothetical protein n=1 Tax=Bartonella queenslandensis TaxID=481138 RepID=UPI001BAC6E7F|nr:hypothetical protein [Bartonella queenslandensis]
MFGSFGSSISNSWSNFTSMNFSSSGSRPGCTVGDYLSAGFSMGHRGHDMGVVIGGVMGWSVGGPIGAAEGLSLGGGVGSAVGFATGIGNTAYGCYR